MKNYIDCTYNYFIKTYKRIDNIPRRENYTYSDKSAILNCTINYLVIDSVMKASFINNFDKIVNEMK
jgi:hypothetical protein